jgi:DNA ligase (NAD+)
MNAVSLTSDLYVELASSLQALDDAALVAELERLNTAYRAGSPEVSDDVYDFVYLAELKRRIPDHPFLNSVEPEPESLGGNRVRHPSPMLSTEKVYTREELEHWLLSVEAAASGLGLPEVLIRVTTKLDGMAGRDDGLVLAKRGDGHFGEDVSRAFSHGLIAVGGRGQG